MIDKETISNLLKEFRSFKQETNKIIFNLRKEVKELKEKLSKYEHPKNSNNSSIPPSQDGFRKTKSLRKKSTKKVGGQKGHKGTKLKKVLKADKIVIHDSTECSCCKAELPADGEVKSRQIFDIPKIKIAVTEHRIIIKKCSACGQKNKSVFLKELVPEAQYGNNIKSLGVYLQNYHMIPYSRCVELLEVLANFNKKMYYNLEEFIAKHTPPKKGRQGVFRKKNIKTYGKDLVH